MKEKTQKQLKKEKKLKQKRTFPVGRTVLLVLILAVQVGLIVLGIRYQPKPQDLIRQYDVTVQPLEDGTLDIEYHFVWEALDETEELTWVEIGMANENFFVYPDTVTSNIVDHSAYVDGDYVSLELYFDRPYLAGEVVEFAFKVNQQYMLCKNDEGFIYEFVPCWFNAVQVEQYEFRWLLNGGDDRVWRGSLDYGEFVNMTVQYDADDFSGCPTVKYHPFNDEDAYNELKSDKTMAVVMCCLFAALLGIGELYIVDCYVSYGRGRGFLREYGAHVHVYGRTNPGYVQARRRYQSRSYGGRGGGGCACACACACAGGGRAGCSQKDTYSNKNLDGN